MLALGQLELENCDPLLELLSRGGQLELELCEVGTRPFELVLDGPHLAQLEHHEAGGALLEPLVVVELVAVQQLDQGVAPADPEDQPLQPLRILLPDYHGEVVDIEVALESVVLPEAREVQSVPLLPVEEAVAEQSLRRPEQQDPGSVFLHSLQQLRLAGLQLLV